MGTVFNDGMQTAAPLAPIAISALAIGLIVAIFIARYVYMVAKPNLKLDGIANPVGTTCVCNIAVESMKIALPLQAGNDLIILLCPVFIHRIAKC